MSQYIPNENAIDLSNMDPEVIDGVMSNIQKSFDIVFTAEELMGLQSMGRLCNLVTNKIRGKHKDDCSSQQAFYKLQLAITDTLHISKDDVFPETSMATLFPRKLRRSQITEVERLLGIKIKILRAAYWLTATLALMFFAGFIGLFLDWTIALFGILVAVTGLYFADKFGIELEVYTIGEWTDKIARENYLKARRNPQTVNRNEIAKIIRDLFIHKLGLELSGLSEDTRFNFFEPVVKEDKDEAL